MHHSIQRNLRWLVPAIALILGTVALGAGVGPSVRVATAASPVSATARPAAGGHLAGASVGFSHAVITDEQWPGFEPDLSIAPDGSIYTSTPQGFVGTISPVWSSRDGGNTYQQVPGNVFAGKQRTCVGGGDTDLYTDPGNELYFSDLQGLTNISMSASADGGATWSTNCAGAPNTPDDRMWFAGVGSLKNKNLALFNDYDATLTGLDTNAPTGAPYNQLVETVSTDGTTFKPVVNTDVASLTGDCAGGAVQDCVTDNEGISGNQIVDQLHSNSSSANVYIAHTTSAGEVGVRVSAGKVDLSGPVPTATWSQSPNLVGSLCAGSTRTADGSPSCEDANGNAVAAAVGENFASIAQDSAGYLYVTFTVAPSKLVSGTPTQSGPTQIYLVRSLEPAPADPSKITWSSPRLLTGTGVSTGTNTFPWITAGSDGRIDIAYYHSDETSEKGLYGSSSLNNASWSVQMLQSVDALAPSPHFSTTQVSEGPVKFGQICTNGVGCTTGGDRSLGDFLQVKPDADGAALISYVFDTSAAGTSASAIGPEAISRQISGPSLFAAKGYVTPGSGPSIPMGSVTDPTGDADYSNMGTRTPASDNLDLTGASLANGTTATGQPALVATIKAKNLSSLAASPSEGGPDASWLLRWDLLTPGKVGNGHIYYVGMDNNAGVGTATGPQFFVGDQTTLSQQPALLTYPQTKVLPATEAKLDPIAGTITITVPLTDVGNPPAGTPLESVTAFTATSLQQQGSQTQFNQIDATTPFDLIVGAPGTVGTSPGAPSSSTTVPPAKPVSAKGSPAGCPRASGTINALRLGPLSLGMTRSRARTILAERGRHGSLETYCLRGSGIRAGYGSPRAARVVRGARRYDGHIVLLLTANRHYRLDGFVPGTRLSAHRLGHVIGRATIGQNRWIVLKAGAGAAVLKVRGGRVQEIGIVQRALVPNARAVRAVFRMFS